MTQDTRCGYGNDQGYGYDQGCGYGYDQGHGYDQGYGYISPDAIMGTTRGAYAA